MSTTHISHDLGCNASAVLESKGMINSEPWMIDIREGIWKAYLAPIPRYENSKDLRDRYGGIMDLQGFQSV